MTTEPAADGLGAEGPVGAAQSIAQAAEALYAGLRRGGQAGLPLRPQDEALLGQCEAFRFGEASGLAGWSVGRGPTVFLTHGWGGRGAQMATLALALAGAGFQAVFFDAGAHGDSHPAPLGFDRFMEDLAALHGVMGGAPFAWVGHSAGALAMMSARRTHGISAERYVCIAAPLFPYVPIERLRRSGAPAAALEIVKARVAAQFGTDWAQLETGLAWRPDPGAGLLAVYDDDDVVAHPRDAAALEALCPGASVLRTRGLGHNRLLQADPVVGAVLAHLSASAPG